MHDDAVELDALAAVADRLRAENACLRAEVAYLIDLCLRYRQTLNGLLKHLRAEG